MLCSDAAKPVLILHLKPASSLPFLAEREKIKYKTFCFSGFPVKNRLVSRQLPSISCAEVHAFYGKMKTSFLLLLLIL